MARSGSGQDPFVTQMMQMGRMTLAQQQQALREQEAQHRYSHQGEQEENWQDAQRLRWSKMDEERRAKAWEIVKQQQMVAENLLKALDTGDKNTIQASLDQFKLYMGGLPKTNADPKAAARLQALQMGWQLLSGPDGKNLTPDNYVANMGALIKANQNLVALKDPYVQNAMMQAIAIPDPALREKVFQTAAKGLASPDDVRRNNALTHLAQLNTAQRSDPEVRKKLLAELTGDPTEMVQRVYKALGGGPSQETPTDPMQQLKAMVDQGGRVIGKTGGSPTVIAPSQVAGTITGAGGRTYVVPKYGTPGIAGADPTPEKELLGLIRGAPNQLPPQPPVSGSNPQASANLRATEKARMSPEIPPLSGPPKTMGEASSFGDYMQAPEQDLIGMVKAHHLVNGAKSEHIKAALMNKTPDQFKEDVQHASVKYGIAPHHIVNALTKGGFLTPDKPDGPDFGFNFMGGGT